MQIVNWGASQHLRFQKRGVDENWGLSPISLQKDGRAAGVAS